MHFPTRMLQVDMTAMQSSVSTIARGDAPDFTQENRQRLEHLSDLLHLFHHRNKNQHRRSVWYRHFSLFRRHLASLCRSLAQLDIVPTTHLERVRKKARDEGIYAEVTACIDVWRDVLVARWQRAFSQVAADGRFAVLGVTLTAVLAEACEILGILKALEAKGQAEVEKVLERFEREQWGADDAPTGSTVLNEDAGEAVQRDEATRATDAYVPSPQERPKTAKVSTERSEDRKRDASQKKKRKRIRGDAIDDIFG